MRLPEFIKKPLFVIVMLIPMIAMAQDFGDGDGDGDDVNDEVTPQAPIDSHLVVALAAGTALGYVLLKRRQNNC